MRGGTAVRILGRLLKVRPAPLLIAGIVGAILIVGWLSYWVFSRSHTTPGEIQKKETQATQSQGYQVLTLRGHSSAVDGVAFSPDGKRLATASDDQTAKVWDAQSGQELLTLRGHRDAVTGVAFSPDGKRLATASTDQTAKVWDAESGKELLTLRGHSNNVRAVTFSPRWQAPRHRQ